MFAHYNYYIIDCNRTTARWTGVFKVDWGIQGGLGYSRWTGVFKVDWGIQGWGP